MAKLERWQKALVEELMKYPAAIETWREIALTDDDEDTRSRADKALRIVFEEPGVDE